MVKKSQGKCALVAKLHKVVCPKMCQQFWEEKHKKYCKSFTINWELLNQGFDRLISVQNSLFSVDHLNVAILV